MVDEGQPHDKFGPLLGKLETAMSWYATRPKAARAWWNKMLKTKAVAALKGKGKKLMPGEHNKAW